MRKSIYKAIPPDMKGCYSEFEKEQKTWFLEIHFMEYNPEEVKRYKKLGVYEESSLYSYFSLVSDSELKSARYVYKLSSYTGDKDIDDVWEFSEKTTDYKQYGFTKISELLAFCEKEWGVKMEDFVPIHETNIPH